MPEGMEVWKLAVGVGMWRYGGLEELETRCRCCWKVLEVLVILLELPERGKFLMGFGTATARSASATARGVYGREGMDRWSSGRRDIGMAMWSHRATELFFSVLRRPP